MFCFEADDREQNPYALIVLCLECNNIIRIAHFQLLEIASILPVLID